MTCVITDRIVLSRAPEGPLAVYVGPFADFLSVQGYELGSVIQVMLRSRSYDIVGRNTCVDEGGSRALWS